MRNKLLYILITFISSFSFLSVVNAQSIEEYNYEDCYSCNTEINDSYKYFTMGVGPIIFIPNLGVGYRERHHNLGWDTALSFSTIGYAHQISAQLVGHYYLKAHQPHSPYIGAGLLGSSVFTNKGNNLFTLSTDFVFGKELQRTDDTHHFIEMHVAMPTLGLGNHNRLSYLPLMYVKYGISF